MSTRQEIFFLVLICSLIFSKETAAITPAEAMGFEVSTAWRTGAPFSPEFIELSTTFTKTGLYSGKWSNHPYYPTLGTSYVETDWSAYNMISFWIYSEVATNEEIFLAVDSDSDNGFLEWKDFYYTSFKVNWTGWKKFDIPFTNFSEYETVAGWQKIDGIYFYTKLFNKQPNPYTVLYLDDIQLTCGALLSDLNGDCKVNTLDLAIMTEQWLICTKLNPANCN